MMRYGESANSERGANCKCVRPWGRVPHMPCHITSGVFQVEAPEKASRTQDVLMSRETISGTKLNKKLNVPRAVLDAMFN